VCFLSPHDREAKPASAKVRRSRSRSKGRNKVPEVVKTGNPIVKFFTSRGDFEAEIFLDRVPITASNFIDLVKTEFYDGLLFHKVERGRKIQTGCPNTIDPETRIAGMGAPKDGTFINLKTGATEHRTNGGKIKDELISMDSNQQGTLAMYNSFTENTGGSQFFVNTGNSWGLASLPKSYSFEQVDFGPVFKT
jgi:cyclophilin family peptidyl-prolyl cis-trans isomerase